MLELFPAKAAATAAAAAAEEWREATRTLQSPGLLLVQLAPTFI